MNKKQGEYILDFLILIFIISIVINSIIYFIYKNELNIFIILLSLFMVGLLTLILILTYDNKENNFEDYIILDRLEYEYLKYSIHKQEIKLKKQNQIINKIKTIIK